MGDRRIAIYTALFGGYDRLLEQAQLDDVDFVCFTDDPTIESTTWDIRPAPGGDEPRRAARAVKTSPHRHLDGYDWTIWVDARLSIRSAGFATHLIEAAQPTGMAVMAHRQRHDTYQEAAEVYRKGFDTSPSLLAQVQRYRQAGLPTASGLFSTMVVARRGDDPTVQAVDERWLDEIERGSVRDQVSLPFVLWHHDLRPGVVDLDPYQNELYVLHHHLDRRRYPPWWRQRLAGLRFSWATRSRS